MSSRSKCRPTSMISIVRVPGGIRSGRCSRAGVFGKALPAPSTMPLSRPSLPSNAGQRDGRANTAAAVTASLEPIAGRHHQRVGLGHPIRQKLDIGERHTAVFRGFFRRPRARRRHEFVVAADVLGDEVAGRARQSAPVPRRARTRAARRCRAAMAGADRPARRSWCAADRSPPAARHFVSRSGSGAPDADWRRWRYCPTRR